jgi:dTDP-L-rhamnose 4-epimerase
MYKKVLVTGGAGFIGSHLVDDLLNHGYNVRVLDNLSEQIHGPSKQPPQYLDKEAELIVGDVRNPSDISKALKNIDIVIHLAASVGVGQSMYQIRDYMDVNTIGTSVLWEHLINKPVERMVVASSMSIYGEGYYRNSEGIITEGTPRSLDQLKSGQWEITDKFNNLLEPVPTNESKTPALSSVYALSKYDQEQLCLMLGRAYQVPAVALRFFNVYGTRQSLSNPYTGVLAIFASRLLNNKAPLIFEDGLQKRDFISVYDIARACRLAIETPQAANNTFNIGSGNAYTVKEIASQLAYVMGKEKIEPEITKKYRAGDIRHCFADISKAKEILGFTPEINLQEGLYEYTEWLSSQIAKDMVDKAHEELVSRGLTI